MVYGPDLQCPHTLQPFGAGPGLFVTIFTTLFILLPSLFKHFTLHGRINTLVLSAALVPQAAAGTGPPATVGSVHQVKLGLIHLERHSASACALI